MNKMKKIILAMIFVGIFIASAFPQPNTYSYTQVRFCVPDCAPTITDKGIVGRGFQADFSVLPEFFDIHKNITHSEPAYLSEENCKSYIIKNNINPSYYVNIDIAGKQEDYRDLRFNTRLFFFIIDRETELDEVVKKKTLNVTDIINLMKGIDYFRDKRLTIDSFVLTDEKKIRICGVRFREKDLDGIITFSSHGIQKEVEATITGFPIVSAGICFPVDIFGFEISFCDLLILIVIIIAIILIYKHVRGKRGIEINI